LTTSIQPSPDHQEPTPYELVAGGNLSAASISQIDLVIANDALNFFKPRFALQLSSACFNEVLATINFYLFVFHRIKADEQP
jgi:hypothetical protein